MNLNDMELEEEEEGNNWGDFFENLSWGKIVLILSHFALGVLIFMAFMLVEEDVVAWTLLIVGETATLLGFLVVKYFAEDAVGEGEDYPLFQTIWMSLASVALTTIVLILMAIIMAYSSTSSTGTDTSGSGNAGVTEGVTDAERVSTLETYVATLEAENNAYAEGMGGAASAELDAVYMEASDAKDALALAMANDDNYPVIMEIAALPSDWSIWLSTQVFDSSAKNMCDPQTYTAANWWLESTSEDGAKFDGGVGATFDVPLRTVELATGSSMPESAIAWGSDVKIAIWSGTDLGDFVEFGTGPVLITGPGRYAIQITNGGYRVGVDHGGEFLLYWTQVLTCLYGNSWSPAHIK